MHCPCLMQFTVLHNCTSSCCCAICLLDCCAACYVSPGAILPPHCPILPPSPPHSPCPTRPLLLLPAGRRCCTVPCSATCLLCSSTAVPNVLLYCLQGEGAAHGRGRCGHTRGRRSRRACPRRLPCPRLLPWAAPCLVHAACLGTSLPWHLPCPGTSPALAPPLPWPPPLVMPASMAALVLLGGLCSRGTYVTLSHSVVGLWFRV